MKIKEKAMRSVQMMDAGAVMGFAGLAEDKTSRMVAVGGLTATVVGVAVGSKIIATVGFGAFVFGFSKGVRTAIAEIRAEQIGGVR